ncbi:MAG: hypothetical protein ACK4GT_06960 [Pararhodobacter sp.]
MRLPVPPEILLPALSLLAVLAAAMALILAVRPLREAFLHRSPACSLAPGEVILAELRPDRRVSGMLALFVVVALMATALAEQVILGAGPVVAYLTVTPFGIAALLFLYGESRARWLVTNRRVVTALGASLPLAEIGRIAVGPALVRLDGRGTQSLRLLGVADALAAAEVIRQALRR